MPRPRRQPPPSKPRRPSRSTPVERPIREDLVRAASLECLGGILQERHLADRVLDRVLRRETRLYSNERRAVAERVYTVLRRRATFDFAIDAALAKGGAQHLASVERDTLRLALARVVEGDARDRVEADSGLRVSQRGILDAWQDLPATLAELTPVRRLEIEGSLPPFLAKAFLLEMELAEALSLMAALNQRGPLTARANLLRTTREALRVALEREGMGSQPTRYSPWGLHLESRQNAFGLAAFRNGELELQDEGSQLLALAVGARPKEHIVDACSGAGGKLLALAAEMRNQGDLWALDSDGTRLGEAKLRSRRAGVSIARTRQIPADDTAGQFLSDLTGRADRVLVDAPCSGLGALRRNPDARWRLTPEDLPRFQALQGKLLSRFAALVRPGGLLVYATCSVVRMENEEVVARFQEQTSEFEPVPVHELLAGRAGDLQVGATLRLWPHVHGTDGFFAAAFRRRG